MSMFCYQCQEAMKNTGCTTVGMCGKKDDVANLQDLLIYALKGISIFRSNIELKTRKEFAKECGVIDNFIVQSLFATITNANFDREAFVKNIFEAIKYRDMLKEKLAEYKVEVKFADHDAANFTVTEENIDAKAAEVGVLTTENEDVRSLRELLVYGLKGVAAYYEHASILEKKTKKLSCSSKKLWFPQLTIHFLLMKWLDWFWNVVNLVLMPWLCLMGQTHQLMEILKLLKLISVWELIPVSLSPVMILKIWKIFLSRLKEQALMFIHTAKCFLLTIIQPLKNIVTL